MCKNVQFHMQTKSECGEKVTGLHVSGNTEYRIYLIENTDVGIRYHGNVGISGIRRRYSVYRPITSPLLL